MSMSMGLSMSMIMSMRMILSTTRTQLDAKCMRSMIYGDCEEDWFMGTASTSMIGGNGGGSGIGIGL